MLHVHRLPGGIGHYCLFYPLFYQVLEEMGNAAGGNIIIISDGEDGVPNKLQEARAAIISKGVIVDTILYTIHADEVLKTIAKESSGQTYFEQGSATTLVRALIHTEESRHPVGTGTTPIVVKFITDPNLHEQIRNLVQTLFYM